MKKLIFALVTAIAICSCGEEQVELSQTSEIETTQDPNDEDDMDGKN